jgi:hypothetical protein
MTDTALTVPDPGCRADLATFVARVVQLDGSATVRLVGSAADGSTVTAWATTPFEVLAARSVPGRLEPEEVAVQAVGLLTALAVERADTVDPGAGARWRAELPTDTGWAEVGDVPGGELAEQVERELAARPDGGPSEMELDRVALTLPARPGPPVRVPMRCLFALSGLGLLDETDPSGTVRVAATRSWLRLDTPHGSVVRRRLSVLPLLV